MDFESIGVKREELSYQVACAAHSGTSFSPEERARQEQQAYYEDIKGVYEVFAGRITPEQERSFLKRSTDIAGPTCQGVSIICALGQWSYRQ
jgi:hypothetical protein